MPAVRFDTVRDLYEAFPAARQDVGREESDEPSLQFLSNLVAEGAWAAAVTYCVYLLPRREAVWWGCETFRRLDPSPTEDELLALEAAETWVFQTDEPRRLEALTLGTKGNAKSPATWMALAAGWSGGNIVSPEVGRVLASPDQTARALRAGLLIALAKLPKPNSAELLRACLLDGIGLVVGSRVLETP